MTDFNLSIQDWYRQNKRELPWRQTTDPYLIWLSEVILQQTRVDQGLSYYERFAKTFPSIKDLALAEEQTVLNLWQGLGYYSRARNLHAASKQIHFDLMGRFPSNFTDLLKLKGVGHYTAAAIASFSFKEPVAVVDGNVYRVLSRYFDIDLPIDSTPGKKYFQELAQELIDKHAPDTFNQAIMEFGALQCTPSNPNCNECPLKLGCQALKNNTIKLRPVKSKKTAVRNRYFHFLIFEKGSSIIIEKRSDKDIWQNMFQFPLIETLESGEYPDLSVFTENQPHKVSNKIIHILSHQKIQARFYHFDEFPTQTSDKWLVISRTALDDFPLPRLIDRYLEKEN